MALSVLPPKFVETHMAEILERIVSAAPRSTHPDARWIDTRRNCCRSIKKYATFRLFIAFYSSRTGTE